MPRSSWPPSPPLQVAAEFDGLVVACYASREHVFTLRVGTKPHVVEHEQLERIDTAACTAAKIGSERQPQSSPTSTGSRT
jgi:hypothetical protein